jgi:glutathione synthase/RimK-type ligase-like ATP-grasp enzyme
MQFLLLSNPENRRSQFFQEALARQGYPVAKQLSWQDLLSTKIDWAALLHDVDALRIESPGENFEVARKLLALGAAHPNLSKAISETEALQLSDDYGRIRFLRQQHLGFELALEMIQNALKIYPKIRWMNSVESILLSFDKIKCHQHLSGKGINMPRAIYGIGNYEALRAEMSVQNWSRVFIKPNGGSSASGVLAYRVQGVREQLISSVEMVFDPDSYREGEWRYYNSLKVRKYEEVVDIQRIINFICQETVLVEQWIPKATLPEQGVFDFRILVIAGKAMHTVVRTSHSPMTNLHLGNQRGDLEVVLELIGMDTWQLIRKLAEDAVSAMPAMHYAGVDIMLSNNYKRAYLLEVNAFGDLLPNVLVDGLDSYEAELLSF